jgi:hypothetical protein
MHTDARLRIEINNLCLLILLPYPTEKKILTISLSGNP